MLSDCSLVNMEFQSSSTSLSSPIFVGARFNTMDKACHAILVHSVSNREFFYACMSSPEKLDYRCRSLRPDRFRPGAPRAQPPATDECKFHVYVSFDKKSHMCISREANLVYSCPIDTHWSFKLASSQKYVQPLFEEHVKMNRSVRSQDLRHFHYV